MLAAGQPGRLLLRAELVHAGGVVVTHTLGLSVADAFVPMDEALAVGAAVRLRLSFPRLLEPLEVAGTVTGHRAAGGPGDPAGITVALSHDSAPDRSRLAALLTAPAPAARAEYRVLLVDDNSLICDMFAYGVRKYFRERQRGVRLDVAADGAQAWALLQAGGYDLAIVDFYLPVLGGAELIARLRGEPSLAGLPVVAISVGGADARATALGAGADLFLQKPLVLRDLFATLQWLTAAGST